MRHHIEDRIKALNDDQRFKLANFLTSSSLSPVKRTQSQRLIAYISSPEAEAFDTKALRIHLQKSLPNYMIPADIIVSESLARLSNGKIDIQTLSQATGKPDECNVAIDIQAQDSFTKTMREIWSDTLQITQIQDDDDFFEIGGDSLLSIAIELKALEKGLNVKALDLYNHSTINALAKFSQSNIAEPVVPENAPSCFIVHTNDRLLNPMREALHSHCAVYGLEIEWNAPRVSHNSIEAMAEGFVLEIKKKAPVGPYYIGGYSNSTVTAYEIVRQLESLGDSVEMLFLIDPLANPIDIEKDEGIRIKNKKMTVRFIVSITIKKLKSEGFYVTVKKVVNTLTNNLYHYSARMLSKLGVDIPISLRIKHFALIYGKAQAKYKFEPINNKNAAIFLCEERRQWVESLFWKDILLGKVTVDVLDCIHIDFWYSRVILADVGKSIADKIKACEKERLDRR